MTNGPEQTRRDVVTESIRDELAELTLALCNIPSETCNEAEIATWVQHRCVQAAGAHLGREQRTPVPGD